MTAESITASSKTTIFAALTGLTSLAILAQAITAGQFVSQDENHWIDVHGVIADVAWALALITAIYAWVALRDTARQLAVWSSVLFVMVIAQTWLGHQITDDSRDGLIAIHVPLAFLIFALTIWLSIRATSLRRNAAD